MNWIKTKIYKPGQNQIRLPRLIFPSGMIFAASSCHWQMVHHEEAQSPSTVAACVVLPRCFSVDTDAEQW